MRAGPGIAALASVVAMTAAATAAPRPIVGFRMRGETKVTDRTGMYLSRHALGDRVDVEDIPELEQALLSSELFEQVTITLEDAPGGVIVVATVIDKHSWIVAPTLYLLSGARAFGVGFIENNLAGRNQKLAAYGQLGNRESVLFGTYLDPAVRGTRLTYRFDVYAYRRISNEYANPTDDATDDTIARATRTTYLGGGALVGWRFAWWLIGDVRPRGAYVQFDAAEVDGEPVGALPVAQTDGWDVSVQGRLTLDARQHRFGVTWGPYAQLMVDTTVPGLDDYGYSMGWLRAYHSWRLREAHQLELRGIVNLGRHLPFHEELTMGGVLDLRGYQVERFRGDVRTLLRVEYSVPIARWRTFDIRSLGFWDSGYSGLHSPRQSGDRAYLPGHGDGVGWWRNDVGVGLRVYVRAIVLPLLGVDVAYGIEGRRPELYFQLGLTDF